MDTRILQSFKLALAQQKQNLLDWLRNSPPNEKEIRLGPADSQAVDARLHTLDEALVKAENKTLGLCEVCHDYVELDRLEMDFTACVCIDHYSPEQKRQLESELELSHKVQKALLPQQIPVVAGLELSAFSQPAQIVGGDYYDFFQFRDGTFGLVIADVMGKGLPASMLMASLQASLRILVTDHDSPAEVIQKLNRVFCHNIHLIKFITIFLGRYDVNARRLEYCNAGQNPPLLVRQGQTESIHWLKPTGAAIGLAESFEYDNASIDLQPDDVLVFYTDGLIEAMNTGEEEYGEERLVEVVRASADRGARDTLREIRLSLHDFTASTSLEDDFTLIVAKGSA